MSLQRYIPTRLLEACDREAKACFGQESLGLESQYKDGVGAWKIYAYPLLPGTQITPLQININNVPQNYETGVGGVNESLHTIDFDFFFPPNILKFAVGTGANTYLDHVYALRDWLAQGGTWAARLGRELPASPIEDPDAAGVSLGSMVGYQWGQPQAATGSAAAVVPVLVTYQSREDSRGAKR